MFYKRPLVISDNLELCQEFKKIVKLLGLDQELFTYSISPFSNISEFSLALEEVKMYDLRNDDHISEIMSTYDIVFSIHCKQLFPPPMTERLKCINVHPGYNPINRGWYPQVFAILNDLSIGATIHEIDNKLDNGPIIARSLVEKFDYDTSKSLYDRVVKEELKLIESNLINILDNNYTTTIANEQGNLYLKRDFNELLELDLEKKVTFREAINLFRATSHGDYLNTYFLDGDGNKVYLRFDLVVEE